MILGIYSSYFKLHVCWLSSLTPVTYRCKLQGILCVAAFLQLELFSVYTRDTSRCLKCLLRAKYQG
ncbi:hypothetical protein C9426_33195 [Serratia sp. S1B]|nr:hypothetical protein C9426_33195 [Serratia sp. S1B]